MGLGREEDVPNLLGNDSCRTLIYMFGGKVIKYTSYYG